MIREVITLAIAALLLVGCEASDRVSVDRLIERHTESRGGAEAIEKVHSLRLTLEITEPGFVVRGDYVATRDGYMRIDIYSDNERVFTEALGPGGGWQLMQGATVATDLSEDGEKALTRGLIGNLYGLHELSKLNYTLSLSEIEAEDAESSWAIDQVGPDGHSKRLFMDQSSFLITRTLDTSALHPDIDDTQSQTETRYADFETFSGVLFARRTEKIDTATAQAVQTVVVRKIDINPTIDASRFDRPSRISP
jgi:hypothetical protein